MCSTSYVPARTMYGAEKACANTVEQTSASGAFRTCSLGSTGASHHPSRDPKSPWGESLLVAEQAQSFARIACSQPMRQLRPEPLRVALSARRRPPEPLSLAPSMRRLAPEPSHLAPSMRRLAPEPSRLAPSMRRLAPEPSHLAPSMRRLAPEPLRLAPSMRRLPPELLRLDPSLLRLPPSALRQHCSGPPESAFPTPRWRSPRRRDNSRAPNAE
jgi:hypothetical protein